MVKAININNRIILGVPKFWVRPDGSQDFGYNTRTDATHYADGWKDVVEPVILTNQRRGQLFFDTQSDVFRYEVVDFTE